jgi:hypothetical protein
MSRGVEARGSFWTLGVPRALGTFRERAVWTTAYPAPVENTGGGVLASLRLILRSRAESGVSKDGAAPWFETALRASSP